MSKASSEAWECPGWRRWYEKRGDDSTWEITENAMTADYVLLQKYLDATRLALERGEALPSVPPLSEVSGGKVICVERTERRVGGYWRESDGRIFWESDFGMVFACDADGRPITDPHFKNRDPTGA